jgi:hypothetical protein
MNTLNAGAGPQAIAMPNDRYAQAAIRVALRQIKASDGPSHGLTAWFAAHDSATASDDAAEEHGA